MNLVVDTSVILAVITNENHKKELVEVSKGVDLIAPPALHWEIGNAFSAMFKRNKTSLEKALVALAAYRQIPIRFYDVKLDTAIKLSSKLNVYAYDAYFIVCALRNKCPLITLDGGLIDAAQRAGAEVKQVIR